MTFYRKTDSKKNIAKNLYFVGILSATDKKKQDPEPDPNPNPDTDPYQNVPNHNTYNSTYILYTHSES